MPNAYQLVAGFYTGGAAGTGVATPMAGDTFNIANFNDGNCYLENIIAEGSLADFISIHSPRMHDNNQGIRLITGSALQDPYLPSGVDQPMYSGDTPVVSIDVTAAGTGALGVLYWYDDLPGASPRLAAWADVQPRIKNISGVQVALGAVGAIGQYSAGVAINSSFDNFQANADYALLGYVTATSVLAVSVAGQDTGNLKVGGPGVADPKVTRDWFIKLSADTSRPHIPIIAANNKGSTLVYQTDNTAHAAQNCALILAELA